MRNRFIVTAKKQTKTFYYTGESMVSNSDLALLLAYYSTAELRMAELKTKHKDLTAWTIERASA